MRIGSGIISGSDKACFIRIYSRKKATGSIVITGLRWAASKGRTKRV
jgi:hypothetical protein